MGQLSESQLASVRMLIQSAPDSAVRDLETTLAAGSERHETMRMIQQMVSIEAADRRARNAVFSPLTPLFTPRRDHLHGLLFPSAALGRLWQGVKEQAPFEVRAILAAANDFASDGPPNAACDALCEKAARGVRERSHPGYEAAAAILDRAMPGGAEVLGTYLDLAPVARSALDRMPEWLGRLNEERSAAARLTFRDAVAVAEDAGPRLLEILYAHLEEPWAVLRLVSAVMHRPGDKFVAASELATFGERLLDDIDARLKAVAVFNADGGPEAGRAAGEAVRIAGFEIQEFDDCVDLSREGPWGSRLNRQKRALAQAVEGRLKGAEAEVAAALPLQSGGFKHRGARGQPRLTADPDPRQTTKAVAFLTLLHEVRSSADQLGFGALWNKVAESIQARLETYVEDLLEKLRTGEGDNLDRVRLFLDVAAELMGLVCDDKAAQIVRRRVAAAA